MSKLTDQHPALGGTVGGMFRDTVIGSPDAIAVRDGQVELTYRELNDRVNRLTAALTAQGLRKGDRVALLSENCLGYVEVLLACAKGGFIAACLNWRQTRRELEASIALADPGIIFTSPEFVDRCPAELLQFGMGEPLDRLIAGYSAAEPEVEVASEDGLIILYTSGTTGTSKGALVSHRAMIARGTLMRADWSIRRSDGFIAWSPLFHMASADPTLATLMQGGTVSVVSGFDPEAIVSSLTVHDVGWMVLMPGMIERLATELERCNEPLRRVACAGCMANLVPADQIRKISLLLNAPFLNTFGSSETGIAPASGNWIEPGADIGDLGKRQNSSCEIRLIGDDGQPVAPGQVGEICLRGPLLFSGYWNDAEATDKAFRDGWYHMGDAFYRDTAGNLHFADRKKYLIKSGGENIYPAEIELLLRNIPGIHDAVVVKRTDRHWGEVPVAFVVADADASGLTTKDVQDALAGKIARYKLPKEIHLIRSEEIERNPTGKIRRDLLERRAQTPVMIDKGTKP